jgi:hypothetical protein
MVGKGPLNWSTQVDAGSTALECIKILTKHGASKAGISIGEDQIPDGIEFIIKTSFGPRGYSLTVNSAATEKVLKKAWRDGRIEPRFTTPEQAKRVAWRVLKDWLEAQMALIEMGLVELPQVMLPYLRVDKDLTMYQAWAEQELKQLEGGSS